MNWGATTTTLIDYVPEPGWPAWYWYPLAVSFFLLLWSLFKDEC